MPLYEYRCRECGRQLEVIQRFSDAPLTDCTECGGQLEKVVSAPAFHLKGSGWYKTDYGRKDGGSGGASPDSNAEKSGTGEKSDTPDKKESSSDKKPTESSKKKDSGSAD